MKTIPILNYAKMIGHYIYAKTSKRSKDTNNPSKIAWGFSYTDSASILHFPFVRGRPDL